MRPIRNKTLAKILAAAIIVLALGACSSTRFVSTWKEPTAGPTALDGQRIAAFVVSENAGTRRTAEDVLARELTARGALGVAGYTLLPGEQAKDREAAKVKLQQEGIVAVVVMRAVGKEQEVSSTPSTYWYRAPSYRRWGGYWGHGWGGVYSPGEVRTDTYVFVEILAYDLSSEKLIWAGRSKTTNPDDVAAFVTELATAVDDEMRKSGLLR